ncbi:MAG: hypothetical protein QNJ29_07490 [Rhizobiaceae bacterium]|nr:hypothetical protein [Rhizobiaceae bacterium]
MHIAHRVLHRIADYSRWALIAGLLLGIFIPSLAEFTKPWIGHWVAILLFLSAFRIEPKEALGGRIALRQVFLFVAIFQIILPILIAVCFLGLQSTGPVALALLIVFASAPISGSPGLTMITGNDPTPALRFLISATALLPFTVLLPFYIMPGIGDLSEISWIAFKLFLLIFVSSGLAFATRQIFMREPSADAIRSIDGLTAIAMAVLVIGLMTGFSDAMESNPSGIVLTLLLVFAVNFGVQLLVWFTTESLGLGNARAAFSICAGNKNVAIFLAALPVAVTDPLLLFIACYQIPMYLTPTLLGRLYRP